MTNYENVIPRGITRPSSLASDERCPGSDLDEGLQDRPHVPTVVLLPKEEEESNEVEVGLVEEEKKPISLEPVKSPPATQTLHSLQLWDRSREAPKPKFGDGMKDGLPNLCYIVLYLLSNTFLLLFILSQIGWVDSHKSYWFTSTDKNNQLLFFLIPFLFFYALFQSLSLCGCCDNTIAYLINAKPSSDIEKTIKLAIAQTDAKVCVEVVCWHTETTLLKNRDYSETSKAVATFRRKYPVRVKSCIDQTDFSHIDLHKYKITKVKLIKAIVPDENFSRYRDKLYNDNKHLDDHCNVTEMLDLGLRFPPCTLCLADGQRTPFTLHPTVYIICHILLVPALPYRLWMGCITGKMRLEIRKSIQTDPSYLEEDNESHTSSDLHKSSTTASKLNSTFQQAEHLTPLP